MGKSKIWYILPILFGIIGGIIMYFVVRSEDSGMAKNGLLLGIVLTVVLTVIQFAAFGTALV